MSSHATLFRLRHTVVLLGPPGSGKGFYGQRWAQLWDTDLITTSTVVSGRTDGSLVDCETVATAMHQHLTKQKKKCVIIDGFPRTCRQVQLMKQLMKQPWPAVRLVVPQEVCMAKMRGRYQCRGCGAEINTANVQSHGFSLPPRLCSCSDGDQQYYTQRPDDADECTVRRRLELYHEHDKAIVEQLGRDQVLDLVPYRGEEDVLKMARQCEQWLDSL